MINTCLHAMKTILLIFICIVAGQTASHAVDYYVDPSGSDDNAGTENAPWQTISKANEILVAGDTVYIKAGTYSSFIAPQNSGTILEPITYRNYDTETVTISDAEYGILLDAKSHIIIQGINFYNLDKFLWLQNGANYNIIAYCSFDRGRNMGWSGSRIYRNSSYNRVHHCTFSHYGYFTNDDIGSVLDIGDEYNSSDLSNNNLIENNTMYHGGHHVIGVFGMYTVVRNNYFHNEIWDNGHGNRVVYLNGYAANSGRNLIEGNKIAYSGVPPDQPGAAGMSMVSSYNIVRLNSFYHNDLAGISVTTSSGSRTSPTYNKIYHNTFFHNAVNTAPNIGQELKSGIGFANYEGPGPIFGNAIKNNIFHSNPKPYGAYRASFSDQVFDGNWEESGDPLFVNADITPGDPMNSDLPDLHLRFNSPCIDAGAHVTRIASESGCGTTFRVEDAGYFMNGWSIVQGDNIQIAGTSQKARITGVNYSTDTVTVDTALAWTQYDGLNLAYHGNARDLGAYEHVIQATVHTVMLSAGQNGSLCPGTPQAVEDGSRAKITVTPDTGYAASVGGTCGGTLDGNVFTTDSVYADCTITAVFSRTTHTVTPSAGLYGKISPSTPQTVNDGSQAKFTVTANKGYTASMGGTCGGTLVGTTFTTSPVYADCTVAAIFSRITHTVTPTAGPYGTISPSSPQSVYYGSRTTFKVTPNAGYRASVGGTCGGYLRGSTYTTKRIYNDCTVTARFIRR